MIIGVKMVIHWGCEGRKIGTKLFLVIQHFLKYKPKMKKQRKILK